MNEELIKQFESLTITNDLIFGATFEAYPELCKRLIEIILDVKVEALHYVEREKAIEERTDAKGIRLDVYVEEQGTNRSFDVEMQIADKQNIGKRMRYYQGMIDMDKLKPGEDYKKLGESYVIFICMFDPFKRGLSKYTFRETCEEDSQAELNDGTMKVVVPCIAAWAISTCGLTIVDSRCRWALMNPLVTYWPLTSISSFPL